MMRAGRHFRKYILCNARDHEYGRCTMRAGHGDGRWHCEVRRGRIWAQWRGPIPGERCGVCGTDHRQRLGGGRGTKQPRE